MSHINRSIDELFIGCTRPPKGCIVLEPFAGDGAIMKWIGDDNIIIPYDSEPKVQKVLRRNVLVEKLKYYGTYVITKAPQLKKSDSEDKTIFEQYGTDNLYKCFIKCLITDQPTGGIIVLPIKFLSGLRESEVKRRQDFFRAFKPTRINVFDMETVVIDFAKRPYTEPFTRELWSIYFYPENTESQIEVENKQRKISTLGLISPPNSRMVQVGFSNEILEGWQKTNFVLQSLDTDKRPMGLYPTLEPNDAVLQLRGILSKKLHVKLCNDFNSYIICEREKKVNIVVPFISIDEFSARDILESLIWSYTK